MWMGLDRFTINNDSYLMNNYEGLYNDSDDVINLVLKNRGLLDFGMWGDIIYDTNASVPITYRNSMTGLVYNLNSNPIQKQIINEINAMFSTDRIITEFDIGTINSLQTEYDYRKGNSKQVEYNHVSKNQIDLWNTDIYPNKTRFVINYETKNAVLYDKRPFLQIDVQLNPDEYIRDLKLYWKSNRMELNEPRTFGFFERL